MRLLQSLLVGLITGVCTQCIAYSIPKPAHNEFTRDTTTSTDGVLSLCALTCVSIHAPEFGCEILDIQCQCDSQPIQDSLTICALENCTAAEALAFSRFGAQQCHQPTDHYHHHTGAIVWSMMSVMYISYVLRMVSRLLVTKVLWWDDLFHSIATVFCIPMTLSVSELERLGIGYHIFQLEVDNLPKLWFWFFMSQLLWTVSIMFLKTSVLFLYLRIFPGKELRIACYSVLATSAIGALVFILIDLFQCKPVWAAWTLQHGEATCLDFAIIATGSAIFNLITEIAIFVLPLRTLMGLNLELGKKVRVLGLFGLGIIIIVIAGVRIMTLSKLGSYTDATYDNYHAWLWTGIEITAAHVCVSAPGIAALFTSIYRGVTSTLSKSISSGKGSSKVGNSRIRSVQSRTRVRLDSTEQHYGDEVELRQINNNLEN